MTTKKNALFFALFTAIAVNAQTVTPTVYSNQGGYNSSSGGSISWTIGEPISETYSISTNITTMGFHQPELNVATFIKNQERDEDITVYPNPVQESLIVNFSEVNDGDYTIDLYDEIGKLLQSHQTEIKKGNTKFSLNISPYAAGNYYLKISGKESFKTAKITKVQ